MDKYEYRLKTDQMKKLMDRKDALGAMKIADTIDWRRVKDVKMLTMAAESYVANGKYDTAIDLFLQAYEFAPIGRRIMYRLTEVAIEAGNFQDAKTYYEEFHEIAPHDLGAYILKYQLEKAKGAPVEQLIEILEAYRVQDFDERWSYELAELYYKAGRREDCVRLCDDIILWFSLGKYVEKAMRLKMMYEPLTPSQREKAENQAKYAEKLRIFQEESERQEKERLEEEQKEKLAAEGSGTERPAGSEEEKSEPAPADPEPQPEPSTAEISDQEPEAPAEEKEPAEAADAGSGEEQKEPEAEEQRPEPEKVPEEEILVKKPTFARYPLPKVSRRPAEESVPLKEEAAPAARPRPESFPFVKLEPYTQQSVQKPEPAEAESVPAQQELEQEDREAEPAAVVETGGQVLQPEEKELWPEPEKEPEKPAEVSGQAGDTPEKQKDDEKRNWNFLVTARDEKAGFTFAVEKLKEMSRQETGRPSQVARISGEKLNKRGILAVMDKLRGKVLLVEKAGLLQDSVLDELEKIVSDPKENLLVVLIDTPVQIGRIMDYSTLLAEHFPTRYDCDAATADSLAEYALKYAEEQECVLDDMAVLALYVRIDEVLQNPDGMEQEHVKEIMEEAIDRAEHKGGLFKGLFGNKLDEEGRLVLKEEHFKA